MAFWAAADPGGGMLPMPPTPVSGRDMGRAMEAETDPGTDDSESCKGQAVFYRQDSLV